MTTVSSAPLNPTVQRYNRFLLLVAGLGGLLYGIDVAIIGGALPYLEATSGFNQGQLSLIVASVLLGSAVSTMFAGALADWMGRKRLMALSGVLFVVSIPMIALAQGFGPLVLGRLLQGISAGLIGVVVPLYLAECLSASQRGKGTAIFQWMLTLGIVVAAAIGMVFSYRLDAVSANGDAATIFAFKDTAWRSIFWASLPPGLLFVAGCFRITESPRWLHRRGRGDEARTALLRSRTEEQAELELAEMAEAEARGQTTAGSRRRESLLQRKYVVPFVLACVILACNQATGVNSIIGYNTTILLQAGLPDFEAHIGYVALTVVNFLVTIGAVVLVDRKGRKFLLSVGSAGIIVTLLATGFLFHRNERHRVDCAAELQQRVTAEQSLDITVTPQLAADLLRSAGVTPGDRAWSLIVIYSYGDFRAATRVVRTDDRAATLTISRAASLPANEVIGFFSNPAGDVTAARNAPLRIENALLTPVPSVRNGWLSTALILGFMAFFAIGPGVCVWLALSELMPTRIRSNGMSIALLINQAVSTGIAATFLPTVGKYGYATMFFAFAGCTVIYFITAAFFLPETKGRTLEEIEAHFEGRRAR